MVYFYYCVVALHTLKRKIYIYIYVYCTTANFHCLNTFAMHVSKYLFILADEAARKYKSFTDWWRKWLQGREAKAPQERISQQ